MESVSKFVVTGHRGAGRSEAAGQTDCPGRVRRLPAVGGVRVHRQNSLFPSRVPRCKRQSVSPGRHGVGSVRRAPLPLSRGALGYENTWVGKTIQPYLSPPSQIP